MIKGFREFIMRGNVIDLAVGLIAADAERVAAVVASRCRLCRRNRHAVGNGEGNGSAAGLDGPEGERGSAVHGKWPSAELDKQGCDGVGRTVARKGAIRPSRPRASGFAWWLE